MFAVVCVCVCVRVCVCVFVCAVKVGHEGHEGHANHVINGAGATNMIRSPPLVFGGTIRESPLPAMLARRVPGLAARGRSMKKLLDVQSGGN